MPDCLNSIRVEKDSVLFTDLADLMNRLNCSDLIVGIHDRDQAGILPDRRFQFLRPHQSVLVHRQERHLIALFFQPVQGMQDRVVFKSGRNDVLFPLLRPDHRR